MLGREWEEKREGKGMRRNRYVDRGVGESMQMKGKESRNRKRKKEIGGKMNEKTKKGGITERERVRSG